MASPFEFTSRKPEIFQRADLDDLVYVETRRDPSRKDLSGNLGVSPMILGEENYRRTDSTLSYDEWRAGEFNRAQNRLVALHELTGLDHIASARLPHGTDLIDVDERLRDVSIDTPFEKRASADASVSTKPGVGLLSAVGDCIPATIVFPGAEAIATTHVGIRGAAKEIIPITGQRLTRKGLKMEDAAVYIGPHAHRFQMNGQEFDELNDIISKGSDEVKQEYLMFTELGLTGYPILDLAGIAVRQFERAGVRPEEIQISSVDTLDNEYLYSNYTSVAKGVADGRFGVLVGKTRAKRS